MTRGGVCCILLKLEIKAGVDVGAPPEEREEGLGVDGGGGRMR